MGISGRLLLLYNILSILTIFYKTTYFSLALNDPSNLGFPPSIHFDPEEISNDVFNINDTIEKQNNFQDSHQGLGIEKKENQKNITIEYYDHSVQDQRYGNFETATIDTHYLEYYEYLLHRVVETRLPPYPNRYFEMILNKLKLIFKGGQFRWINQIKPEIDHILEKVEESSKVASEFLFTLQKKLSTTFPYAYSSIFFIFSLVISYIICTKPKRAKNIPSSTYDQEIIISMLNRINWLCEASNNKNDPSPNTSCLEPGDGLSSQLDAIQNNLKDIDLQLQDLGSFANILTTIVQRLEQDIQSLPSSYVRQIQMQPDIDQSRLYTNYSEHEEFQNQNKKNEKPDSLANSQLFENGYLV